MNVVLKEMKNSYEELLLHKTNKEIVCALPIECLKSVNRSISDIDSLSIVVNKYYGNNNEFPFFDEVKTERLISLDGEFFIIKTCRENKDEQTKTLGSAG